MTIFQSILIAIIEGITEFLPISSTAHMKFANPFLGISPSPFVDLFEIVIQFAAIASVLVIYRKQFFNFKQMPDNLSDENLKFLYEFREKLYSIFSVVFKDYIDEWSASGYWPEYIDNWKLNEPGAGRMHYSVIEILKHDIHAEKNLAITFHTDAHKHRVGQPRAQQIITITI